MDNPLAGKPLDYLIGAGAYGAKTGRILEVGYDAKTKPAGLAILYCNLFDEKNSGNYGPYLHNSDTAAQHGLKVIAKNPGICSDPGLYVRHANIYGIIVERDAGTPREMDKLRKQEGKPSLPVWFVFFGARAPAQECARQIKAMEYRNMGVTLSTAGEYVNSIDVLVPL